MSNNNVKITLTDSRPMLLSKAKWPLVARASEDTDHNNQELFRRYYLRVRIHAALAPDGIDGIEYYGRDTASAPTLVPHRDGRVVVYGWYESSWQGENGIKSGYVCALDDAAQHIRQVGEEIGADESLIIECIGGLPPIDETGNPEPLAALLTDEDLSSEVARRNLKRD